MGRFGRQHAKIGNLLKEKMGLFFQSNKSFIKLQEILNFFLHYSQMLLFHANNNAKFN